ncbi:hypothetical protein D3C86_2019070 [compost metagenome]
MKAAAANPRPCKPTLSITRPPTMAPRPIPRLAPAMFSDAAKAGASGAAFIRRTWLTRNKAAWVTPQIPIAAARPSGE